MLTNIKPVEALSKLAKKKNEKNLTKKITATAREEAETHGWKPERAYTNGSVQISKPKPYGLAIADRVWSVLYKMKFLYMNGEDSPQLSPDRNTPFRRNLDIDMVSVDYEVGVAVFVKASPETREADDGFHQELELYAVAQPEFAHSINSTYKPAEQRAKIKGVMVVFACNVSINEIDKKFAKAKNIALFDENDLVYYEELVKHLGTAAKYQFLADILDDADVPALTIEVPAIRLKVKKIVYYSFAIHPEYLLKISYVAHRVRGKKAGEQAYQRMVERQRLTEMREYIDKPAIFPTNIVINLKKKPRFEEIAFQVSQGQCGEFGKLILKNTYKSAWIIDGQHRLYSYSDHASASSALLSVIAFEELPSDMQMEFFVDINSKQKRVEQTLLNELFDQAHKDSPDPADRMKSLISQAISILDEDRDSPFYQRILGSKGKKGTKRCITLTSVFGDISDGLFTHYENGVLCVKGDDDATRKRIVYAVKQWFVAIKKDVPSWWDAGSVPSSGGLAMNDSISACFIVLRNVMQHLITSQNNLALLSNEALVDILSPYALIVSRYLYSLTKDDRQVFRTTGRGIQGQTQRARTLLLAIQKEIPDFVSPTLKEHFHGQENEKAKNLLIDVKEILLDFIRTTLQDEFGEDKHEWWDRGVPHVVKQSVLQKYNGDAAPLSEEEKYLDFQEYMGIIQAHWDLFKGPLGHSNSPYYSASHLAWLRKINDVQDRINYDKKVTPTQLSELMQHRDWLYSCIS